MDERPQCETGIHQNSRGEHRQQPLRHRPKQPFHDTSPKPRETKDKMNFGTSSDKKLLHSQGKSQKKLRGSPRNGRRYLQMTLQIKDWYPKSTKNFSNSIHKKQKIASKNGQKNEQTLFQ